MNLTQARGEVKACFPQSAYANADELPLHEYGAGPFCYFQIPKIHAQGFYLIRVNTAFTYVGECEDLSNRFNAGYGNISPRNCFVGGSRRTVELITISMRKQRIMMKSYCIFMKLITDFNWKAN